MTIHARDLSCQGLTLVDRGGDCPGIDPPTFHGKSVEGYFEEMRRRGEDHVFSCDRIGHMDDETSRS